MEQDVFLGLPLLVMAAFVALLVGLALLGRQLHRLHKPAVVRAGVPQRAAPRPAAERQRP